MRPRKIQDPKLISQILTWKHKGYSYQDIIRKLKEEYDMDVSIFTLYKIVHTPYSWDQSMSADFYQKLTEAEEEKIQTIVDSLKDIIELVNEAKEKVTKWFHRLSNDLEEVYQKEKEKGLNINKIIAIKESLKQDIEILSAYSREFSKFRDIFMKMMEIAQPKEVTINKVDLYLQLAEIVEKVQKDFNVYWVEPADEQARKILIDLIKSGRFKLYSEPKKKKEKEKVAI